MRRPGLVLVGLCLLLPMSARAQVAATPAPELRPLDVPRELRVVSYYPSDAGWTRMWEPWRPERIAADLQRLRSLNANTVRIVLPAHFFGYPQPEQARLEQLREFVEIAARTGLYVHFTLFDWWGTYGDVSGSKQWARAVLKPYVGDPRLAFVELRNEIDTNDVEAVAWTRELVPWLRKLLRGRTPVTVSVGGMNPERDLRALTAALPPAARPDFFDAHYFMGSGERAQAVFSSLRDLAAPTPLWIGEIGYPTSATISGFPGVPLTASSQEAAQDHYFKLCFSALARLALPAPGLWILDDFGVGAIPASDVNGREPEYRFGLFREDGSPKAAASTVTRMFAGRLDSGFNGGFETVALAEDGSSIPAVWASFGNLRLLRDPTVARSGTAAALVAGPPTGTGAFVVTPVVAPVRAGGRAEVAAWFRGANGVMRVGIGWFDRDLRRVGESRNSVRAGGGWRRASVSGRPPPGAEFARVVVRARGLERPVWIDDVTFGWR